MKWNGLKVEKVLQMENSRKKENGINLKQTRLIYGNDINTLSFVCWEKWDYRI